MIPATVAISLKETKNKELNWNLINIPMMIFNNICSSKTWLILRTSARLTERFVLDLGCLCIKSLFIYRLLMASKPMIW